MNQQLLSLSSLYMYMSGRKELIRVIMISSIKEIKETILKSKKITVIDISNEDEASFMMKISYENDSYIVIVRDYLVENILINITNPISFEEDKKIKLDYESINEFNRFCVGTKSIILDVEKKHAAFIREDFIRSKDRLNKDLIEERIIFGIGVVDKAVFLYNKFMEDRNNEEKK